MIKPETIVERLRRTSHAAQKVFDAWTNYVLRIAANEQIILQLSRDLVPERWTLSDMYSVVCGHSGIAYKEASEIIKSLADTLHELQGLHLVDGIGLFVPNEDGSFTAQLKKRFISLEEE